MGNEVATAPSLCGVLSSGGAWARGWGLGGVSVRAAFGRVGLQFRRFGDLRRLGLHGPVWRLLSVLVPAASPRWPGRLSSAVARLGPAAPSRGGFRTPSARLARRFSHALRALVFV